MLEINKIYNIDCLEGLKQIEDKSIDLLLTDIPYGLKIGNMNFIKCRTGGVAERTDYSKHNVEWDNRTLNKEEVNELLRISKQQVIFGGNFIANHLPISRCWVVWDKKTEDKYTNDFSDCELIYTSFNKPSRMIRYLWNGMLQDNMKNKEKRVHPTQKPVAVVRTLLEWFSKENDLILDSFIGSGTTALACKQLKRNFIGFEINKEYCDITNKRLEQTNLTKW